MTDWPKPEITGAQRPEADDSLLLVHRQARGERGMLAKLLKAEPAVVIGAVVALAQVGYSAYTGDIAWIDLIAEPAQSPLVTILTAFGIRQTVSSPATVEALKGTK